MSARFHGEVDGLSVIQILLLLLLHISIKRINDFLSQTLFVDLVYVFLKSLEIFHLFS